jgi:hypothetical protein
MHPCQLFACGGSAGLEMHPRHGLTFQKLVDGGKAARMLRVFPGDAESHQ